MAKLPQSHGPTLHGTGMRRAGAAATARATSRSCRSRAWPRPRPHGWLLGHPDKPARRPAAQAQASAAPPPTSRTRLLGRGHAGARLPLASPHTHMKQHHGIRNGGRQIWSRIADRRAFLIERAGTGMLTSNTELKRGSLIPVTWSLLTIGTDRSSAGTRTADGGCPGSVGCHTRPPR